MRSQGIVVVTPGLKFFPNINEAKKQVYVQAFIPETTVEALHKAVLYRMTWPDEVQLYAGLVGPDRKNVV